MPQSNLIDFPLVIIGSGPAAFTASIYAGRARIKHAIISGNLKGGQLVTSPEIENFPGLFTIDGTKLMHNMEEHAKHFGAQLILDHIESVDFQSRPFILNGHSDTYKALSVIVATGSQPKQLGLDNEDKLIGRGISYCATCDGNFYRNKNVAIVGGGNTALEEAIYLSNIANKVFLIHRRDSFRGEKILQDQVLVNPKISILWNTIVTDLHSSNNELTHLSIKKNNNTEDLKVDALFVAIGHYPSTNFLNNSIKLDNDGYIITNNKSTATSINGIFAAGDVQNPSFKQAVISAGSGATAALEVSKFLSNTSV